MELLQEFFIKHGFPLTLIAFAGIVILGILKYTNLFKAFAAPKKKAIYLVISVGLSYMGSLIYLIYTNQSLAMSPILFGSIYALNQGMYSIYENTSLKTLVQKGLNRLEQYFITLINGEGQDDGENKD